MSDDGDTIKPAGERAGFADTPSKDEWLGLLRDLSDDLATLEASASTMRARIDMIVKRIE